MSPLVEIAIDRRVNDQPADLDFLFRQWAAVDTLSNSTVIFNFTGCDFLQQNAVAFLGGMVRLIQYKGCVARFRLDTIIPRVRTNLEQNGFLNELGFTGPPWDGNSIPYREDRTYDYNGFADFLSEKWLGRGWILISEQLKSHIIQPILEAYINVFDHADSPVGVVTCGQHYPRMHVLKISLVDFGIGIPNSVRNYLRDNTVTPAQALKWAFEPGSSTKTSEGLARGVGLKILKSFIEENNGKLEIYSDSGYTKIARGMEQFTTRGSGFSGTLVQLTLQCDERFYHLPSEQEFDSSELLF